MRGVSRDDDLLNSILLWINFPGQLVSLDFEANAQGF